MMTKEEIREMIAYAGAEAASDIVRCAECPTMTNVQISIPLLVHSS